MIGVRWVWMQDPGFVKPQHKQRLTPVSGGTFTNLIGASPNLAIRAWQPNRIESSRSNFTHFKRTINSYNPIVLDRSRLLVYSCPHRASLLSHSPPTPSVPPIIRWSGRSVLIPSVPRTKEHGRQTLSRQIRTLPDRIYKRVKPLLVVTAPAPNHGPVVTTDFFLKTGAHLEHTIGNVITSADVRYDRQRSQFPFVHTSFRLIRPSWPSTNKPKKRIVVEIAPDC